METQGFKIRISKIPNNLGFWLLGFRILVLCGDGDENCDLKTVVIIRFLNRKR